MLRSRSLFGFLGEYFEKWRGFLNIKTLPMQVPLRRVYVQESSGEIYFNNTCNLTLTVSWMKIIMVFNKVRSN